MESSKTFAIGLVNVKGFTICADAIDADCDGRIVFLLDAAGKRVAAFPMEHLIYVIDTSTSDPNQPGRLGQ